MHVNNITDSNSDYHLFTLLAHVVLHSVTCTGGLSLPPTTYRIYSTATCTGPIVTCTVWWWYIYIYIYSTSCTIQGC